MALPKLFFLSLVLTFTCMEAAARPTSSDRSLAARLQEGSTDCWSSLMELRACTGEVILFFMNSETSLGPSCCRAIRIIERQCWPSLLLSIGFTAEEGDILKGYCDDEPADEFNTPPNPPSPPPQEY